MKEVKWTTDQEKIIKVRDCNVLVSAAAGSGKTAVLIERIFNRIMDEKNPVNVDQFLVVTFTKAAAAQMKDRLRTRIEEQLKKQPDNKHLQRQIGLISSAHISTIHSFCSYVIQNYFHRIGLDPSFRQATQTEVDFLQSETFLSILEEEYEKESEDFVQLAEMSEWNRRDDGIEEMVKQIYKHAMSQPFVDDFFDRMDELLQVETIEEWEETKIIAQVLKEAREQVKDILEEQKQLHKRCLEPGAPLYYENHITEIGQYCEDLLKAESYEKWRKILSTMTFQTMRKRKDDTVDEQLRLEIVERRNQCKKNLQNISKQLFPFSSEENLNDLHGMRGNIQTLLRITRQLHKQFVEAKRERNMVDFNDLEQLALSILLRYDKEKNEYVRTEAAIELAEHFVEIMIDEYQDSNRVQDTLLHSVSREGLENQTPNIFMVGDVKQSIYRFRGACPELFEEKMDCYSEEENTLYRRIDLHQNFRSRETVLEGANAVFRKAMRRDVGGVEYDKRAELCAGRVYPKTDLKTAQTVELYALLGKQNSEAEGYVIAKKIKEMVQGKNALFLAQGDTYRKAEYRDIVLLVLAHSQGQQLFETLTEYDIPVVMERKQGFYKTREIELMVSMLRVIDNPHQDIPLATVLLGPMFRFKEEELAEVRIHSIDSDLFEALCQYDKSDLLYEKIQKFFETLDALRSKVTYATVAELVQDIYDKTGIYDCVMMMKDGAQRVANMDCLMEQARQFDATTYHGLYQFVRYLEKIEQQTEEIGEVNMLGEEDNVVRIMTIHKSKGLEFPICIVAGMGRKLNLPHTDFLSIHPEFGIVSPVVDNEKRTKKKNFYTQYINECNKVENIGESIRKLYVAMTRAEEKLIMVGCVKNTDTSPLNYEKRKKFNTMFDMVLPAKDNTMFELHEICQEQLLEEIEHDIMDEVIQADKLYNFDTSKHYHEKVQEYLKWMEAKEETEAEPLPVKVSVSDLKVKSMQEKDIEDFTILTHEEEDEKMPIPKFMSEQTEENSAMQGAAYGTVWHQVMATIDFEKASFEEGLEEELNRLLSTGRLRQEEIKWLNKKRLLLFFNSELGKQMTLAAKEERLHREQPFVIGRKANEIFADRKENDTVLVQGIIDGYYECKEGIVLMDYKTDSLKEGEEHHLIERYQSQMDLYRQALEEMTGKKVIRSVLYSFSLGKEIIC